MNNDEKILELERSLKEERDNNILLKRKLLNRDIEIGKLIPTNKKLEHENQKIKKEFESLKKSCVTTQNFQTSSENLISLLKNQYKKSELETERTTLNNFIEMLQKMSS